MKQMLSGSIARDCINFVTKSYSYNSLGEAASEDVEVIGSLVIDMRAIRGLLGPAQVDAYDDMPIGLKMKHWHLAVVCQVPRMRPVAASQDRHCTRQ